MNPDDLLEKLVKRTEFTESHAAVLRLLEPRLSPLAPEVALAFYDYLGRDDEMRNIIWGVQGRVERLYLRFSEWYRELFSGTYDSAYAQRRAMVGLVHASLGIRPSFIMPAMGIVQELTLEHMRSSIQGYDVFEAVEAFQKIIAIENGLMQDCFLQAVEEGYRRGMVDSVDNAAQIGAKVILETSRN